MQLPPIFNELIDWLKEWQLLVGSLIALCAAAITVSAINRQVRTARSEAIEKRQRRVCALLAGIPQDLNAVSVYARRSTEVARDALSLIDANEQGRDASTSKGRQSKLRCPTLPAHVPTDLVALIEGLDSANAKPLVKLLQCYYGQHTRLVNAVEDVHKKGGTSINNLNMVLKDTLELYIRAASAMQFARGELDLISDRYDASDILNAMKILEVDQLLSPEAREHCLKSLVQSTKAHGVGRILSRR
jgi:hypothetical protein